MNEIVINNLRHKSVEKKWSAQSMNIHSTNRMHEWNSPT